MPNFLYYSRVGVFIFLDPWTAKTYGGYVSETSVKL